MQNKKVKALGLMSGGLDSILACLLLRDQDIDVTGICFETPFFGAGKAQKAAQKYDIPLIVMNIFAEYMPMLTNPNVGYGRNMNPCMDCHSLMFKIAGRVMAEQGFDFLFSGEVLGQRPMSQTRTSLQYVLKHSENAAKILRPLSALRLPETEMEQQGLVDRSRLCDITGRSRKPQKELAARLGMTDVPQSGGGCLLTDPIFSVRLRDLLNHETDLSENNVQLLNFGRHFRLNDQAKLIVGRDQNDNRMLMQYFDKNKHRHLKATDFPGPDCLVTGEPDAAALVLAAAICAGYSRAPMLEPANVRVTHRGQTEMLQTIPLSSADAKSRLI